MTTWINNSQPNFSEYYNCKVSEVICTQFIPQLYPGSNMQTCSSMYIYAGYSQPGLGIVILMENRLNTGV